jgi:hypothetical protein
VLDIVEPDRILGPALFPVVSLAVGILLFVGGWSCASASWAPPPAARSWPS